MSDPRLHAIARVSQAAASLSPMDRLGDVLAEVVHAALGVAPVSLLRDADLSEPIARQLWEADAPVRHRRQLLVPVRFGEDLVGAIAIGGADLDETDLETLRTLANVAALALYLARAFDVIGKLNERLDGREGPTA